MKNKQKQLKIKEKNKLMLKTRNLKLEDQKKSTEGIFLKGHESNETKN